jgi:predicted PolB exonuclease-like 3'-5' exonuclease
MGESDCLNDRVHAAADILTLADGEAIAPPAFLILDTESVPDGRLLSLVKYADDRVSPAEAVRRARTEAREHSPTGSDFLPVSFQYPVAVCILRVGADFSLQGIKCLDAPLFRPRKIVEEFWRGVGHYKEKHGSRVKLVTFNGRTFDLPLLELAAFRYGCCGRDYFYNSRNRYNGELDLYDWLTNHGACRLAGGLNLLSKMLGKPGKMQMAGDQVYELHLAGKIQEINDYCMCDTLDTYFVFVRTRIMTGDLSLEQEENLVARAKVWIAGKASAYPALRGYLDSIGDWKPWP